MSEQVTAEEMQDVVDGLKDAKRDAQCLLTDETFDELIHFCRAGVAAIRDRDAGWSAAEGLAEQMNRPLYERICDCGDFESQHQGGGPCGVCCQSDKPYDGCEVFRFSGQYGKLTDFQKGLAAFAAAKAKRNPNSEI